MRDLMRALSELTGADHTFSGLTPAAPPKYSSNNSKVDDSECSRTAASAVSPATR